MKKDFLVALVLVSGLVALPAVADEAPLSDVPALTLEQRVEILEKRDAQLKEQAAAMLNELQVETAILKSSAETFNEMNATLKQTIAEYIAKQTAEAKAKPWWKKFQEKFHFMGRNSKPTA